MARIVSLVQYTKGGRTGDVFLPDALTGKLRKFWAHKTRRWEGLQPGNPLRIRSISWISGSDSEYCVNLTDLGESTGDVFATEAAPAMVRAAREILAMRAPHLRMSG